MKEVFLIVGFLVMFLVGSYTSWSDANDNMKELVGYDYAQLKELKEACEKQLPRDKFCKITVDVKPD